MLSSAHNGFRCRHFLPSLWTDVVICEVYRHFWPGAMWRSVVKLYVISHTIFFLSPLAHFALQLSILKDAESGLQAGTQDSSYSPGECFLFFERFQTFTDINVVLVQTGFLGAGKTTLVW
jgi:hypothetical protein